MSKFKINGKCIIRTYSAGVFFGKLQKMEGKKGIVKNARRLWKWEGAASLSELAEKGTSKPDTCKFPVKVKKILLMEIIEVLKCSEKAISSIESVPVWTAHKE